MSHPGSPAANTLAGASHDAISNDFLASRDAKPDVRWILDAAGGNPSAGAPTGASQASGAGSAGAAQPPQVSGQSPRNPQAQPAPDLPLGLQLANSWRQRQAELAKPLPAAGESFTGDVAGAWSTLKKDFFNSYPDLKKFQNEGVWDRLKDQFSATMSAGKTAVDAFQLVTSPISGALDEATAAVGKGAQAASGGAIPARLVKQALDQAMIGLGPESGGLGAAAKAGAAAKLGDVAVKGARDVAGSTAELAEGSGAAATGKAAAGKTAPRSVFDIAGESPGAALKITPELRASAARYITSGKAGSPLELHLDQLAGDPAGAVQQIAKVIPKDGVKPVDVTRMAASSLNMTPSDVMANLRPKFPSDEMFDAAAMAMKSAGEQFWNAAKKATADGATPADMEEATRAYTLFNEYAGHFRDAKTDWGRAGRIQQEVAGSMPEYNKHIQKIIEDVGPDNINEVIRKTAALDSPEQVGGFTSTLRWMGSRDGLLYGWYNYRLGASTIVKKLVSDATVASWNVAARYAAEKFGTSGAVPPGETAALISGYTGSFQDAIRAAGKALKAGRSQFGSYDTLEDETRMSRLGALSNGMENVPPEASTSPTWQMHQVLRSLLPTSWIGAADDFAKVMNYRAEARALLYRAGVKKNLSGDALSGHIAQGLDNMQPAIHGPAMEAALRNTFQEPLTGFAQSLQATADSFNLPLGKSGIEIPLGRVVMPFVKVPANIARFAYRNGPLPLAFPSATFRAELAQGGAARDLAYARVGLGTGVMLTTLGIWAAGQLTGGGPTQPELRRAWLNAGNKPYSIRIGDTWYEYNRVEPLGMVLGSAADTADVLRFAEDRDAEDAAFSFVFGAGNAMLSKTYLSGLADFLDALHDPNTSGKQYADNLLASFAVPQVGSEAQHALDPWLRSHTDLLSTIEARAPGLSLSLPPSRNVWGDALPRPDGFPAIAGGAARMLSPVTEAPAAAQPIDKWIFDNAKYFPEGEQGRIGINRPGKVQSFSGGQRGVSVSLRLTDRQLDHLRVQAGNGLKDPASGLGARDALNALVEGKSPNDAMQQQWNGASPAARALMVLSIWNKYREAAKQQLVRDNPDIQQALQTGFATRKTQLSGVAAPTLDGASP